MPSSPFRGSEAVARGLLTPGELRGPRFRRLLPDVYAPAAAPVTFELRSRAAAVLVEGRGVLGGHAAAELLGASCGPPDAPAEVVLHPGWRQRPLPGLLVRRCRLASGDVERVGGIPVTGPRRTAYDLARRLPLVEAVVAVDALAHRYRFAPSELLALAGEHPGARGLVQLADAVRLSDPLAESPMETRIRTALVLAGLPRPTLQHPVGPYVLDLAYPHVRLGIEYDGREHLTPERARRDLARQDHLTAAGWTGILRFGAATVLHRPHEVVRAVRARLLQDQRHMAAPATTGPTR